jgi:poly-gamma-glutamate synthesis protein (capsule biosynthesis protein)
MMNRRQFLGHAVNTLSAFAAPKVIMSQPVEKRRDQTVCLFLCGDVMTGRGIDQVMPYSCDPVLYEPYVRDANRYVDLAEALNGPIPRPVDFAYIWGDALEVLQRAAPDVRIINLETSITTSDRPWPYKGINYRMHPGNISCLTAAGIDCCVLANNHVLDWGVQGLEETLHTLHAARIKTTGAGQNQAGASAPAEFVLPGKCRVLVFSYGMESSGVFPEMAAANKRPGVQLLPDLSRLSVAHIRQQVQAVKRAGDIVVVSIHWGGNWGYDIPPEQRRFAHQLIENSGVDIIHGHSSHHVKGIEVYKDKPIIYGCGDLLNDYEGIEGYEAYRADLSLMYFLHMDPASGRLVALEMAPTQISRFQLHHASANDRRWLGDVLNREGRPFNTGVEMGKKNHLLLQW